MNPPGCERPGADGRIHMAEHDKSGPKAAASSVAEDAKGKVKEAVGNVVGNDRMADEGRAQQDKADAERDVAKKEAKAERFQLMVKAGLMTEAEAQEATEHRGKLARKSKAPRKPRIKKTRPRDGMA